MAFYPSLLYLKEFRCVTDTDESYDDSPYFLVFIGNRSQENFTDVVRLRLSEWDNNAHDGKLFTPNLWAHNHVDSNTVVVVALVEEDFDPDFSDNVSILLKSIMKIYWESYKDWNLTTAQRASLMVTHFSATIKGMLANDEFIQARHLSINTSEGDLPLLNFYGEGGHYRVRFKMVNTQA